MTSQQYFFDIFPSFNVKFSEYRAKGVVFLYFDFDGTLAPIVADPEKIRVSSTVTKNLGTLSVKSYILVSIVSGRELKFMRRHFKNSNILLVGSHGSELTYKDMLVSHDETLTAAYRIRQKINEFHSSIMKNRGAIIEVKKFGAALHYRQCSPSGKKNIRRLAREIVTYLPDTKVTILRGKQVAEINPKIGWTKGRAIKDIRNFSSNVKKLEVYVGDDISDESAFAALNENSQYTVRVRKRKDSQAKYFFKSQREVEYFLELLAHS